MLICENSSLCNIDPIKKADSLIVFTLFYIIVECYKWNITQLQQNTTSTSKCFKLSSLTDRRTYFATGKCPLNENTEILFEFTITIYGRITYRTLMIQATSHSINQLFLKHLNTFIVSHISLMARVFRRMY